ncbi:MAG: hypothetical protein EOO52_06570 [Gammaproteobacteria bacterium]|nr:MAG: hypothetical protein EOO52_06570 [Gammaproteobacteria bacterium]
MSRSCLSIALAAAAISSTTVVAGSLERALVIHNRVAGVPPTPEVLTLMAGYIDGANGKTVDDAVREAMKNDAFYNVTLKNMATPWTNRDQTVFAPLNDYTATVVGLVHDDKDFRTILSTDQLYVGKTGLGLPNYASNSNAHYEAIEAKGLNLKDVLEPKSQSSLNGLPAEAAAGVMTSRAAAKAFFIAGTNRAMFRFTLMNHMCRDLEQVHDITRTPDFIRQDVSRSPGGDSRVYLNGCIGCHSGMDPMAKAFAYYDYKFDAATDPDALSGSIQYTAGTVHKKYLQNSATFPYGYVTTNDNWQNYWREGINSNLGWNWKADPSVPASGAGAKSMGEELSHSHAFAACQVEKVFKHVCLRKPADSTDHARIETFTNNFANSGYNLKQIFVDTATYCSEGN